MKPYLEAAVTPRDRIYKIGRACSSRVTSFGGSNIFENRFKTIETIETIMFPCLKPIKTRMPPKVGAARNRVFRLFHCIALQDIVSARRDEQHCGTIEWLEYLFSSWWSSSQGRQPLVDSIENLQAWIVWVR
jgi:hypothetical protein